MFTPNIAGSILNTSINDRVIETDEGFFRYGNPTSAGSTISSAGGFKSGSKMFMQGRHRQATENNFGASWKISNNCMDTYMSTCKNLHPRIKTSGITLHLQTNKYETSGFLNKDNVVDDYTFSQVTSSAKKQFSPINTEYTMIGLK